MGSLKVDTMMQACIAVASSGADVVPCVTGFAEAVGWKCTLAFLGYIWLMFLFFVHSCAVRVCCGRLRGFEAGGASKWVSAYAWKTLVFVNIVLAPKDVREWGFWYLWFSSVGLIRLLTKVGKQHFEHVVDNPNFGAMHTLRVLSLHALVLYGTYQLACLGWTEFSEWGQGSFGKVMLSSAYPSSATLSAFGSDNDEDVDASVSSSAAGGGISAFNGSMDPERGGSGFALMLLYDVVVDASEVSFSALKYVANLLEMYNGPSNTANPEDGLLEQMSFFAKVGLTIASGARTLYIFRACGHCSWVRKCITRVIAIGNGAFAIDELHRAACKVVLAREMDESFPDATTEELKAMPKDETCAICLKTMTAAKRLECNHFFHGGCLQQYLNNSAGVSPLCPICRAPVPWQPSGIKAARDASRAPGTTTTTATTAMAPGDAREGAGRGVPGGGNSPQQELPGIFTGNAPRPDSFTRGARGAYAAARIAHNIARTWRNEFDVAAATAAAAAAVAEGAANAGARAQQDLARQQVPVDAHVNVGPTAASARTTEAVDTRVAHGGGGAATAAVATGGNSSHGAEIDNPTPAIEAAAQQLMEIFPGMGRQRALRRVMRARGSVQRAVDQILSAGGGMDGGGSGNGQGGSRSPPRAITTGGAGAGAATAPVDSSTSAVSPVSPRVAVRRRWW